jgi:hypothetical protein
MTKLEKLREMAGAHAEESLVVRREPGPIPGGSASAKSRPDRWAGVVRDAKAGRIRKSPGKAATSMSFRASSGVRITVERGGGLTAPILMAIAEELLEVLRRELEADRSA